MKRLLFKNLIAWKKDPQRKPLIVKGARQVGKTWLLKEFGKREFTETIYLDFEQQYRRLSPIFENDLTPKSIIKNISMVTGKSISINNDLLIFDEIQACPRALSSLKYFSDEMPQMAIAAAGSLMGLAFNKTFYPVGKVNHLELFPLNFEEFLLAYENKPLYEEFSKSAETGTIASAAHQMLWEILTYYYVVGGMPGIAALFFSQKPGTPEVLSAVRKRQKELLVDYHQDYNKHSGKQNALHIASVFENIPRQLSSYHDGSVQRYKFKDVLPHKKGLRDLAGPIDWLLKTGLVIKTDLINRAEIPLKAFSKANMFKLYIFDTGLLGALLDIPPASLILQNYGITKGYFAENYTACELRSLPEASLYSWKEKNSEIEFIREIGGVPIPIEVKAGSRTKAQSLRQYIAKYDPATAVKITSRPLDLEGRIKNVPLYLTGKLDDLLGKKTFV